MQKNTWKMVTSHNIMVQIYTKCIYFVLSDIN